MKTQKEIEKLANDCIYSKEGQVGFTAGYNYCLKDNADKKYTEEDLHTILKLRREWYSHTDKNVVRDFLKELNAKQ